jgi:hypothetical protein
MSERPRLGPPSIKFHDWEMCHRESQNTVSNRGLDTFDQIMYFIQYILGIFYMYIFIYLISILIFNLRHSSVIIEYDTLHQKYESILAIQ